MKHLIAIATSLLLVLAAQAQSFPFLNFVKADAASGNSYAATGTTITFNGTRATVTTATGTHTVSMDDYAYLEFSDTQLQGGGTALPGDVNKDGVVDIIDINCIVDVLMGGNDGSALTNNGDVNGDGVVDVIDINCVIMIITG